MIASLSEILDRADAAYWIYHFEAKRVVWANRAALEAWDAESCEDLAARDLSVDMSHSVDRRLHQYREGFISQGATFYERWTLYPKGKPRTLRVKLSGITLEDGTVAMLVQGTDVQTAEPEAIRSVEALLHAVVMISMFDADGALLYCNPAAQACWKSHRCGLIDRFADRAEGERFLARLLETGREETTARVDGPSTGRWHHIVGVKCSDAVTGEMALVLSESDVTEARVAQQLLEISRNEALAANQMKSKFIANISHEIRTPLNGVLGIAQLLRMGTTDAEQVRMIDTILSSGQTLLGLINDVLDMSRIESGLVAPERSAFRLRDMAEGALDAVRGAAALKGLGLEIDCQFDCHGIWVQGDERLIGQVLVNLLGNAVKFSDRGTIVLGVSQGAGDIIRFEVRDQGPGVAPDEIDAIFERFRKGSAHDGAHTHDGTGLGLSIVRELVQLMEGEIGVISPAGEGAVFWLELPLPMGEADAVPPGGLPMRPRRTGDLTGRVLVVEDNATNAEIFVLALRSLGLDVDHVSSSAAALQAFSAVRFDLVILDLRLPDGRGEPLLAYLRADGSAHAETPAIVVSADATRETRERALAAGATEVLTKPFNVNDFLDIVYRQLERGAVRAMASDPSPAEQRAPRLVAER